MAHPDKRSPRANKYPKAETELNPIKSHPVEIHSRSPFDNMDPSAPSQPSKATAYRAEGNEASLNPEEENAAKHHTHGNPIEKRLPVSQASGLEDAMPSSLGYGTRGAPAGEEKYGKTAEQVGRNRELDGEQMRAPGEGDVADAVRRKPGASGSQPDLASDLDRKKAEQESKREAIKEARQNGTFSDGGDPRAGVQT
ncbi:hypothetical protein BJ170DRAFT_611250 [Xylariales sp. AK1849]|nr:hypothetical protein BJ170DRAFT_611250 [Xylariales sp. AK1849]